MAKLTTMIIPPEKFLVNNGHSINMSLIESAHFYNENTIMHFVRWTLLVKTTLALPYFL